VRVLLKGGEPVLGLHLVDRKLDKLPSTKEMHEMCMECTVYVVAMRVCLFVSVQIIAMFDYLMPAPKCRQ